MSKTPRTDAAKLAHEQCQRDWMDYEMGSMRPRPGTEPDGWAFAGKLEQEMISRMASAMKRPADELPPPGTGWKKIAGSNKTVPFPLGNGSWIWQGSSTMNNTTDTNTDKQIETQIEELVLKIASEEIHGVETLETRMSDGLDFHDIHVACLKKALTRAFTEGMKAGAQMAL